MKKILTTAVLAIILSAGCASVEMSEKNTIIVMAKNVVKDEGVSDISDVFTYEGKIYVFATFRWDEAEKAGGTQTIEVKWFNGEKLMWKQKHNCTFGRQPHFVWFSTHGTVLGAGTCRVEMYANNLYVGSKSFTVVEKESGVGLD